MNNNPYEQNKSTYYGPYQSSDPYAPPPPPTYLPMDPYAPPPPAYPPPDHPYAPPQPAYQPPNFYAPSPTKPPHQRNKILLIVGIVAVLIIGSILGVFALHAGSTPQVASATPVPPTPTTVPYPALANAYGGSVHNITFNQDANMAMTSVAQDRDKISGNIKIGLPLIGSGSFTGTVTTGGAVNFVLNSNDDGKVMVAFTGTVASNGSMSGSYTVSSNQKGTWKASPTTSPVVYPILYHKYSGSYDNTATGKSGALSMQVITQDQQNFNGILFTSNPLNGTVGSDNSIQFSITDTTGQPIKFTGTVNIDGSLSGTYIANSGGRGTWKVTPLPS